MISYLLNFTFEFVRQKKLKYENIHRDDWLGFVAYQPLQVI